MTRIYISEGGRVKSGCAEGRAGGKALVGEIGRQSPIGIAFCAPVIAAGSSAISRIRISRELSVEARLLRSEWRARHRPPTCSGTSSRTRTAPVDVRSPPRSRGRGTGAAIQPLHMLELRSAPRALHTSSSLEIGQGLATVVLSPPRNSRKNQKNLPARSRARNLQPRSRF